MKAAIFLVLLCLFDLPLIDAGEETVVILKEESRITYHVSAFLHGVDAVSKEAVYHIEIDTASRKIRSVSVIVPVRSFDSGNVRRDANAMEAIDAAAYPEAAFSSTSIDQRGDSVQVSGKLTFHGISKEINVPAALKWLPNRLDVHGDFAISLTDFKVDRPSIMFIPIGDTLRFTIVAAYRWD